MAEGGTLRRLLKRLPIANLLGQSLPLIVAADDFGLSIICDHRHLSSNNDVRGNNGLAAGW